MSRSVAKTCTLTQSNICVRDYWIIFVNWHAASGKELRSWAMTKFWIASLLMLNLLRAFLPSATLSMSASDMMFFASTICPGQIVRQLRFALEVPRTLRWNKQDIPDRFHYLGKPWLFMFKTEIYSRDEYVNYLERNPTHNLLMSNMGMERIDMSDPKRHIEHIIDKNYASYKRNADDKKEQSIKTKEKNEAKRKTEAASAYGQTPAKCGTVSSAAESSSNARSSGDRAPYQGSSRDEKIYIGERSWYRGAWYQKIIRYGRTEWETQ